MMFSRALSTASKQGAAQLRKYNPFVEFKSDINRVLDQHIQTTNHIVNKHIQSTNHTINNHTQTTNRALDKHAQMTNWIMTFYAGGMALGFNLLYTKSETDKKELNSKIETNAKELNSKIETNAKELNSKIELLDNKLDKVLSHMEAMDTKRGWFF